MSLIRIKLGKSACESLNMPAVTLLKDSGVCICPDGFCKLFFVFVASVQTA